MAATRDEKNAPAATATLSYPLIDQVLPAEVLQLIDEYSEDAGRHKCVLVEMSQAPDKKNFAELLAAQSIASVEVGYVYVPKDNEEEKSQDRLFCLTKEVMDDKQIEFKVSEFPTSIVEPFYREFKPTNAASALNIDQLKKIQHLTGQAHKTRDPYNPQLSFFNNIKYQRLKKAAVDILWGSSDVDPICIALVKIDRVLLFEMIETIDPLGRKVRGTLLQIAAMAGDVDLLAGITEEKEHGLVEQLAQAGNLTAVEIAEQLQVIASPKAKQANEARNKRVLDAIIKFGGALIEKAKEYKDNPDNANFVALQQLCQPLIDQLAQDLTFDPDEVITSGYIFDLAILHDAAKWFETNVGLFHDWSSCQSDIWWVNGFGKLQSLASARDAHVINAGIINLIENRKVPLRTLMNQNDASDFYHAASRLGVNFFLGGHSSSGDKGWRTPFGGVSLARLRTSYCQLMLIKTASLLNLCGAKTIQIRPE